MTTNTTPAVLAQRVKDEDRPPHPLAEKFAAAGLTLSDIDDFPTCPWAARAWCEEVMGWPVWSSAVEPMTIWEPAVNRGYLLRGLSDYTAPNHLFGSDFFDYGTGFPVFDFLSLADKLLPVDFPAGFPARPDWVVTNPPFSRASAFIDCGMKIARQGVAILARTQFIEGVNRFETLYSRNRWAFSQFAERLNLVQGCVDSSASRPTAYGWLTIFKRLVSNDWIVNHRNIRPCRARLERAGDYRDLTLD